MIYTLFCLLICFIFVFFFFKQKTAYEMHISDWSSDVCSSDLGSPLPGGVAPGGLDPYGPVTPAPGAEPAPPAPPVDYTQAPVPPTQQTLSPREQFLLARRQSVLSGARPAGRSQQAQKEDGTWKDLNIPTSTSSYTQDMSRVVPMDRVIPAVLHRTYRQERLRGG